MFKIIHVQILTLIGLLVLSSCNEKIAPALSDPASGSTTTGSTAAKSFKLTETSNAALGYVLHKTGESSSTKCEISESTFDSPAEGQSIPATHDITCFLEAEESFLHYNGVKFKLEADAGICEKIVYTPYSFYQWQPGSSSRTMTFATCDDLAKQTGTFGNYICDTYRDSTTAGTSTAEDDLCVFDYSDIETEGGTTGPNCDTGEITIYTKNCAEDSTNLGTVVCDSVATKTTKKCGGKVGNCVSGPILEVRDKLQTNYSIIYDNSTLAAYSNSWEIPSPYSKEMSSNMYVSNFNRQCAGVESTNGAVVPHEPDDFNSASTFDANKMMSYSRQGLQNHPTASDEDFNAHNFTTSIYADDPFRGSSYVNPFYEFACLDGAQEVKARIRVVVRDWDRVFSNSNAGLALVSDWGNIDSASSTDITNLSYMDTGLRFLEAPEDTYPHSEGFNDFWDWDDWFNPDSDAAATAIWPYNPFENNADGSCDGVDDQGLASALYGPKAARNFPRFAL